MSALHKFDLSLGLESESICMYTVALRYTKRGNGITLAKFMDEEMAWMDRRMAWKIARRLDRLTIAERAAVVIDAPNRLRVVLFIVVGE